MENIIVDTLKWLLAKSDPTLIACFFVLAFWQWKTSKLIAKHLDPKNGYPHPDCKSGEAAYQMLCAELAKQHEENRQDHGQIFSLLRGKEK